MLLVQPGEAGVAAGLGLDARCHSPRPTRSSVCTRSGGSFPPRDPLFFFLCSFFPKDTPLQR